MKGWGVFGISTIVLTPVKFMSRVMDRENHRRSPSREMGTFANLRNKSMTFVSIP
jgi:hypothetical protein